MNIPDTNYVVDEKGEKVFVQLKLSDWEDFVQEFERMKELLGLKQKLRRAFQEIHQIKQGHKIGTTLNEFLDEL